LSSDALTAAKARRDALEGLEVTIAAKAGDEGKLFGSVGTSDIVHALGEAGHVLERHEVRLPEGAFRVIGEYEVSLHLHADVDATIRVIVVPE
jgi:large subunit ribosomal protein L9